jgi:hypothetical protein
MLQVGATKEEEKEEEEEEEEENHIDSRYDSLGGD